MNETQESTLDAIRQLYDRIAKIQDINNVDELRLVLIKDKIKEADKLINDFGKKMYERAK